VVVTAARSRRVCLKSIVEEQRVESRSKKAVYCGSIDERCEWHSKIKRIFG
jgi:hypothetical protein